MCAVPYLMLKSLQLEVLRFRAVVVMGHCEGLLYEGSKAHHSPHLVESMAEEEEEEEYKKSFFKSAEIFRDD